MSSSPACGVGSGRSSICKTGALPSKTIARMDTSPEFVATACMPFDIAAQRFCFSAHRRSACVGVAVGRARPTWCTCARPTSVVLAPNRPMMRRIHRVGLMPTCVDMPPMLVSKASDCRTKLNPCSAEVKVRGEHVSASVLLYRFDCLCCCGTASFRAPRRWNPLHAPRLKLIRRAQFEP
jgi:hypothetical protein